MEPEAKRVSSADVLHKLKSLFKGEEGDFAQVESQVSVIVEEIKSLDGFAKPQGASGAYLEGEKLVELGEAMGIVCAMRGLTKNQLMKFLGEVKRLKLSKEGPTYEEIVMLRPHLAYATARKSAEMRALHQVLNACFGVFQKLQSKGKLSDPEERKRQFDRFCDFVEAIVAYNRYYEEGS